MATPIDDIARPGSELDPVRGGTTYRQKILDIWWRICSKTGLTRFLNAVAYAVLKSGSAGSIRLVTTCSTFIVRQPNSRLRLMVKRTISVIVRSATIGERLGSPAKVLKSCESRRRMCSPTLMHSVMRLSDYVSRKQNPSTTRLGRAVPLPTPAAQGGASEL